MPLEKLASGKKKNDVFLYRHDIVRMARVEMFAILWKHKAFCAKIVYIKEKIE